MKDSNFDKQFHNPKTRGEADQINKLKKLSTSSNELLKVRKRLERAGYGEQQKEKITIKDGPIIKSSKRKLPQRRKEDQSVFKKNRLGFFKAFFRILTKRTSFFEHHKKNLIKADLISLFKYGCGYVLDSEAVRFVKEEVIIWQDLMKPIINPVYKAGWRNSDGIKFLEPIEFNIIGYCARLVNDRGILEILYQPSNTKNIFNQSNSFIQYYYKLLYADINKIVNSFTKAILTFKKEYPDYEIPIKPDECVEKIKEFFDSKVEENFIVPLLSAMSGQNYTIEQARTEANIDSIVDDDYLADAHLKTKMKLREEKYKKKVKHFIKTLKTEIEFLVNIKDDKGKKYVFAQKKLNIIDISIYLNAFNSNKEKHVIRELYGAIAFFNDYFAPFLFLSVKARKQGSAENIQLFEKNVFSKDYASILKLFEMIKSFVNKPEYSQCTKDVDKSDTEKIKCTSIINDICDFFFNIGEKISQVLNDTHTKRVSYKPLDILHLKTNELPYSDYTSMHKIKNMEKEKIFTIDGIKVMDVLEMIKAFCFSFIKYFESPYVYKDDKVLEKYTIQARLEKQEKYTEILERLLNGEEIQLPNSIYDI